MENPSYKRTVLFENEAFELVSCEWSKGDESAMHDHGLSQCLVVVEEGVFENETDFGFKTEISLIEKGQNFSTPSGAKHRLICISEKGKTLHLYSPKIKLHTDIVHFSASDPEKIVDQYNLRLGEPTKWNHVISLLKSIEDNSISTSSPYFMNQLFAGILPHTLAAQDINNRTRTTLATFEASPLFSSIEKEIVSSLALKVGWDPQNAGGITVPGGSSGNMMALHCARHRHNPKIKEVGFSKENYRIYVSSEAHYSFKKSAAVLGFGTQAIVPIPVDLNGRIIPEKLRAKIEADTADGFTPLAIVATAGTTVLGAFDSITDLGHLAEKFKLWLHIDAAWGAPALFSQTHSHLMKDSQLSHSITFDTHKFFGSNLTSSLFLTQNEKLLFSANDVKGGDYLFHESNPLDRGRMSWQCGRGSDLLSFWTLWKNIGDSGLAATVDRYLLMQTELVKWIESQPRLDLIAKPEFLNVCVAVLPPDRNFNHQDWSLKVRENLKKKNLAMINYSTEDKSNRTFLRLILTHPHLHLDHLKQVLNWALEMN